MSYDYMLVKGKAGGSLEALAESAMSDTIGAAADVKASISRLSRPCAGRQVRTARGHKYVCLVWLRRSSGVPAYGRADGQVRMITMSRC